MKKMTLLIILLICYPLLGQNYQRVSLTHQNITELLQIGLDIDHPIHQDQDSMVLDLSVYELQLLKQKQIPYQVIINDLEQFYSQQIKTSFFENRNSYCNASDHQTKKVSHFRLGSMGGYFTYLELLEELDSMQKAYPHLISTKAPISNFQTYLGKPIHFVKISDHPDQDENEKKILFTALHHAREPASLSQLVYFMWYLLEQYEQDPAVAYLVDHSEIFFVPVVNPDGYHYNATLYPNGGGMWRKNRRNNGDGTYGVDLNRNYAYAFGGNGTSSNGNSEVYKGTAPFSEPETQAIKWLCEQQSFEYAYNYHSFGDLLLFPFGYTSNAFSPDHDYFVKIGAHLTEKNHYIEQLSSALYPVGGDSDDWMYGEQTTKNKIFAFTPEIGPENLGFWPPSNQIEPICENALHLNYSALRLLHAFTKIHHLGSNHITTTSFQHVFELEAYNYDIHSYDLTFTPISENILSNASTKTFNNINYLSDVKDSFAIELNPNVLENEIIQYEIAINNGVQIWKDTIEKYYKNGALIYSDSDLVTNWISSGNGVWELSNDRFQSAPYSYTHANGKLYEFQEESFFTYKDTLYLDPQKYTRIEFDAFWKIQNNMDFASFEVQRVGTDYWEPQCGNYTNYGSYEQLAGAPIYDGNSGEWVAEKISLKEYYGDSIRIRFHFKSDNTVNDDGFYFDNFSIYQGLESTTNEPNALETLENNMFQIYPNPCLNVLNIVTPMNYDSYHLEIYSSTGALMFSSEEKDKQIDIQTLKPGCYFLKIWNHQAVSEVKSFIKL